MKIQFALDRMADHPRMIAHPAMAAQPGMIAHPPIAAHPQWSHGSSLVRRIYSVLTLLLFVILLTPSVHAQEASKSIEAGSAIRQKVLKNKLLFANGKVLVSLPKRSDGSSMLRSFTSADFDAHYGSGVKPEYAFIDDSTDSRFSVSVTQTNLPPSELESHRVKLEASLAKSVKDLIWHKREMLKFGETEWAHLEMQHPTLDGNMVMSDLYMTSMAGHPLIFTVMTDTKQWYEIRKVMQKMMLSVTIQELPTTSDK